MNRRLAALIALAAMLFVMLPVYNASADMGAEQMGNGGLVLDTDPAGGYEGDYVLIYNPTTSSYTSYTTGNMTGLIETAPDPYAETLPDPDPDGVNTVIDVDAQIAAADAKRPHEERGFEERVSYNVGDIRNFTISNYSPGSSNLSFKCVAKGDHCYVWTPSQNVANYYPLDTIDPTFPQLACDEFESKFEQMKSSFGDHSNGTQGDGRINLMYYNIDDGWTLGNNTGYVAGYFSSYDYSSNGLPMIHIDTYPCVYYVNGQGEEVVRLSNSYSVFCHEYQHLINYSVTGGMDTWLNECMSAAAEEICYPGSSIVSRIQSWENYYYSENDDWLNPPHEFGHSPEYELHNGYSMYGWSNSLNYVLPLYSQVSMFSQYLFTHYGNSIFKAIMLAYNNTSSAPGAITNACGPNASEIVKNFRIAVTANDPASFDGLYGFEPQAGYDPEQYHNVANPYDLLSPVIFTGSSCSISGGGAITVKPIGGVYNPPAGAASGLVYIGITRNLNTEPISLEGMSLSPTDLTTYVGASASISVIRVPVNANDYDVTWTSSNPGVATVMGTARSASVTGVSEGVTSIVCRAVDRQTGRTFTKSVRVSVLHYPTLDEALNVAGGTLSFTSAASYPWQVNLSFDGRACANSSNAHQMSSTSTVQTTVAMQQGETLSFEWSVSSESGYDKLIFYANNSAVTNISGSIPFTAYTWTAPSSGTYTFKWSYEKDYSVDNGSDMGYLDNVEYSGDPGAQMIPGDVNMDGVVDSADALLAMRYSMGLADLSAEQLLRGDMDGSGTVTSADAVAIFRIAMGL